MSSKTENKKKDSPVSSQVESSNQNHISPTKYSRLNEKKELANLNDRLACYIDRVRNLEIENERLTREVKTSEEIITTKVTNVKTIYENELSGTRKLLDEVSCEKAKLEIDLSRLIDENDELRNKLAKKINECRSLQDKLTVNENHLLELSNNHNLLSQERMKLYEENKTLLDEKNKLTSMITNLQKTLEEEIYSRVCLQNTVQTIREDFAFKEQVFQQQLTEYKKKTEVTEVDGKLPQVYEERFYESLQEIRDQYEIDLENNKKEIKKLFEDKLKSLEAQLARYSNSSSFAFEEMKQLQVKLDEANNRLADAEEERNIANQKARDLMREIERLKTDHMNEIAKHNLEMTQLREEMTYQVRKYEELMDEKVALDLEIAAYGKLLEGEETRLNITPVTNLSNRSGSRTAKRKRISDEENGVSTSSSFTSRTTKINGDIEIAEVDTAGKFIRLENNGKKEVSLGGWYIIQKTFDDKTNTYFKFHRSIKIKPGGSVTVWSSDSDQVHKAPENLVMKREKWLLADKVSTILINDSGQEVASNNKEETSSTAFTPKKGTTNQSEKSEERCILM